jgi:nitrate reductase (NAD(P)H)
MNFSKEINIGVGLTVLFLVIVFGYLLANKQSNSQNSSAVTATTGVQPTTSVATVYTLSEVAKHNTAIDCWLIINSKVYNTTDYLNSHPGGAQTIIPYCGTDATAAYDAVMKHGVKASAELATIIIGTIK